MNHMKLRQCVRNLFSAVAVCFVLAACGAATHASSTSDDSKSSAAAAQKAANAKAQQATRDATYRKCAAAIKPLRDALGQVSSRLDVGLNYQDYGNRLGDVRVQYDALVKDLKALPGDCTEPAVPLENAMNAYVKVAGQWGDCIDDYNCDFSKGDANEKAQAGWVKASKALTNSDRKLAAIRRP